MIVHKDTRLSSSAFEGNYKLVVEAMLEGSGDAANARAHRVDDLRDLRD